MKAVTISNLKKELKHKSEEEKTELILRLARFKKENKELLTYLLFEQDYEQGYIDSVKEEMNALFHDINRNSIFFIKKSIRKILRIAKKYIRYSKKPETQIEILLHFCYKVRTFSPSLANNTAMIGLHNRQMDLATKTMSKLHEDLQYEYRQQVNGNRL